MFIFQPKLKLLALALSGGLLASLGVHKIVRNNAIERVHFPVCWQAKTRNSNEISFKGLHSVENLIAYGDISLNKGPKLKSSVPVNVNQIACSSLDNSCYGIIGHQLVKLDPQSNWETTAIQIPPELPQLSWPTGITFDPDNNRLLVSSLGGEGYLYSYSLDTENWQAFSLNNVDLTSIVYHPEAKQLYALGVNYGRTKNLTLYRLSLKGEILETIRLSDSILAELPQFHQSYLKPQLIASRKDLILVSGQEKVFSKNATKTDNKLKIYTIAPETKAIKLQWQEGN